MAEPIVRTTHVGSLPRADAIRAALERDEPRDSEAFASAVDEAVRAVVRVQADAGIDVANDGEQGRLAYSVDVTNRLSGFGDRFAERDLPSDVEAIEGFAQRAFGDIDNVGGPVATGPIEYVGEAALGAELERFETACEAEGVAFDERFHTAPSPGAVLRFTDSAYHDSREAYLFDLADALQSEYRLVTERGTTLQIDAPELLAGFTIAHKDATVEGFREHVETYVDAINRALSGVPSESVRLHACWGNYPGPHHHDVELADVIDLFYEADVGALVLEGANPRHQHEHRTIAEHPLPEGWGLVPGVVDVKTDVVEHPEVVAERIERFASAVGDPSRITAAPDCGFETVMSANLVHPEVVRLKLGSLVEGAAIASERLG